MEWATDWRENMFPNLQKKLVFLYTASTGLIMTLILSFAFLFYISSQKNKERSDFQDHLFILMSNLQTESIFADSYLSKMEEKNHLIIYIEENGSPLFFPGSYHPSTDRNILLARTEDYAKSEGIYPASHPISSNLLQSSIFQIKGNERDSYLGNVLVLGADSGYKKLILLQDITPNRSRLLQTGCFYLLIDSLGIALLFFTGSRFVTGSLKPLEEIYRKQQDFIAAASHELRSPLTVIQTSADAIFVNQEKNKRLLETIKSECRRGSSLIHSLLLLASAEHKNWAVKKEEFEIDELLLHLLELYEPVCLAKNGRLLLELPETPLPVVQADSGLCTQILSILLDNAVAYALTDTHCAAGPKEQADNTRNIIHFQNRRIILRAEYIRPHTLISVIDFGPGIPDNQKNLIFERFYRSDKSRNRKEHFGLGLSIAAVLAEIQGAELHVQDTEGCGSTFSLRI